MSEQYVPMEPPPPPPPVQAEPAPSGMPMEEAVYGQPGPSVALSGYPEGASAAGAAPGYEPVPGASPASPVFPASPASPASPGAFGMPGAQGSGAAASNPFAVEDTPRPASGSVLPDKTMVAAEEAYVSDEATLQRQELQDEQHFVQQELSAEEAALRGGPASAAHEEQVLKGEALKDESTYVGQAAAAEEAMLSDEEKYAKEALKVEEGTSSSPPPHETAAHQPGHAHDAAGHGTGGTDHATKAAEPPAENVHEAGSAHGAQAL